MKMLFCQSSKNYEKNHKKNNEKIKLHKIT